MEQTFESRFLAARRAVIAARFQNLNAMQLEGVLTTQGPLLLLAGAGSGKTTVLINRIANLIAFGEGSDSQEVPDYMTEEDLTYLETYLKNAGSRHAAAGRAPVRAPARRAVVHPRHHVHQQGRQRAQKPAAGAARRLRPWTSGP